MYFEIILSTQQLINNYSLFSLQNPLHPLALTCTFSVASLLNLTKFWAGSFKSNQGLFGPTSRPQAGSLVQQ